MKLREYQRASIDATNHYMREHDDNPCVVLPTGAGKSVVVAGMIQEYLTAWPDTRIAIVAHVKELVRQNSEKLRALWPDAPIGIYSAGLGQRDTAAPVIFAGIQSVHNRAAELGYFDLIFIDEAHRIPPSGYGLYRKFMYDCRLINPALRVIGFTATPFRMASGALIGPNELLNGISYNAGVRDLIDQGFLSGLRSKGGAAKPDMAGVHVQRGEYVAAELESAVMAGGLVSRAAQEIVTRCAERKAWLVFCAGVDHAHEVSAQLAALGVDAPVIHGGTPHDERDSIIARYQRGDVRAICNINVLSEGFDAPHVDAVIMLRPTKSAGMYYQQVGRGLRLSPGKTDCLVLDFAGNIAEHGPIDDLSIRAHKQGEGAPPMRECPQCAEIHLAAIRECPACGYEKPPEERAVRHGIKPFNDDILKTETPAFWASVDSVTYAEHIGKSGIPTLKVTYYCGLRSFSEWVCLEHDGYARQKAVKWWMFRDSINEPDTIELAIGCINKWGINEPTRIKVDTNGKFPSITAFDFEPQSEGATDSELAIADRDCGSYASTEGMR